VDYQLSTTVGTQTNGSLAVVKVQESDDHSSQAVKCLCTFWGQK